MGYDPMGYFEAGQKVGKSKNAGFTQGTNVVMDAFKTQSERRGKFDDALALKKAENDLPPTQFEQAKMDALKNDKGVYSFNPVTNELQQVASIPKGGIVRNTQPLSLEKMQSLQSGDIVRANFDTLLKDMEKDPDLLYKIRTPLLKHQYPTQRTTFESAIKEMLSETGGKTLTQSEREVAKSTIPSIQDWAVSSSTGNQSEAHIAARASLKVMSELRKRATARLRANDINAAPELSSEDIMNLRNEAAQEYESLKANNFQGLQVGRADTASDATDTSNIDIEKETQDAMDEIAKRPGSKKFVMAEFKRVTGKDLI